MDGPVPPEKMTRSLLRFGFSEREAALYLAAVRRGRATARELTRDAQLDRVLGYRLLEAMRSRGVIEVTTERPRRFAPLPPAQVLERHLRARRSSLAEDEALAEGLAVELAAASALTTDGAARYQVLTGPRNIYAHLGEMVERAHERIEVMLTFRALRESLDAELGRRLGPFLARGGEFRLLIESDPRLPVTLARIRRATRRFRGVNIRETTPQPSRLTIVDGHEAMLFLVPEAKARGSDQVAVWTDHPGFVAGQQAYFSRAWGSVRGTQRREPRTAEVRSRARASG